MTMPDGPPTGGRLATIKNNEAPASIGLALTQIVNEPRVEGRSRAL